MSLGHSHHRLGWDQECLCCQIQPLIHGRVQTQPALDAGTSLKLDKPWRMLSHPNTGLLARRGTPCLGTGSHSSAQLCHARNSWITNSLHQTEHLHVSGRVQAQQGRVLP